MNSLRASIMMFLGAMLALFPVLRLQAATWTSNPALDLLQDTHVSSASPNTSYGSQAGLGLGYASAATTHFRCMVKFAIPSNLAGATVNSATLEMTGTNSPASLMFSADEDATLLEETHDTLCSL